LESRRGGGKAPDLGLAELLRASWLREGDAVEELLAGRQVAELELGGEVGRLAGKRTADEPRAAKRLGGGDLDVHFGGAVGAPPDDYAAGGDVAALYAAGQLRTPAGAALGPRARRSQAADGRGSGGRVEDEATPPDAPLEVALSAHVCPPPLGFLTSV